MQLGKSQTVVSQQRSITRGDIIFLASAIVICTLLIQATLAMVAGAVSESLLDVLLPDLLVNALIGLGVMIAVAVMFLIGDLAFAAAFATRKQPAPFSQVILQMPQIDRQLSRAA